MNQLGSTQVFIHSSYIVAHCNAWLRTHGCARTAAHARLCTHDASTRRRTNTKSTHFFIPTCVAPEYQLIFIIDNTDSGSKYGWREDDKGDLQNAKLVIAADVIYDDELTDALFGALRYAQISFLLSSFPLSLAFLLSYIFYFIGHVLTSVAECCCWATRYYSWH